MHIHIQKVYNKIRDEFQQTKETRKLAEPRPEDIQTVGWAKPGTPLFEGLDFKQAVARTPAIVGKKKKDNFNLCIMYLIVCNRESCKEYQP